MYILNKNERKIGVKLNLHHSMCLKRVARVSSFCDIIQKLKIFQIPNRLTTGPKESKFLEIPSIRSKFKICSILSKKVK